jgi:hypothetical protein
LRDLGSVVVSVVDIARAWTHRRRRRVVARHAIDATPTTHERMIRSIRVAH